MSKELAREKGIEGYIKKKYPNIYEQLKVQADKEGKGILELLLEFASYGMSVKRYSNIVTPEELEDLDPKCIYVAIKLLNWSSQHFFTTLAYANVSNIQVLHQMLMQMMSYYSPAVTYGEEGETKATTPAPLMIPPAPMRADKMKAFMELLREGLKAFNNFMMLQTQQQAIQGVQTPLSPEVAKKLVEKGAKK